MYKNVKLMKSHFSTIPGFFPGSTARYLVWYVPIVRATGPYPKSFWRPWHQWHGATWDIPTAPRYNPGSTAHISYYVVYHVIVLQVLPSFWSTPVTRSYMGYPYSPMIQPRFYRSYLVSSCIYVGYYRYYPVPDLHQWHGATWDIFTAFCFYPWF